MLNPSFNENWFKHDLYSLSDTNIQLMLCELGPAGYGIFWATVEKLYQNGNAGISQRDIIVLARQLGTTAEEYTEALNVMVRNELLTYGESTDKCYHSKRVSEASQQKANDYAAWKASKSAAGQASGRARRAKRDARNEENEHVLNTNEHVLNTKGTNEPESGEESQESRRESVVPPTPPQGADGQTDDDLFRIPGLEDKRQLTRLQTRDLEKAWGRENVRAYVAILADRVNTGQFTVKQSAYLALSGLLRKAKADGEIHEPAPPPKPVPCPSTDGSCPKCGATLRQTSADGHEWECHACGIRYTSDGGSGWIEEQIGVMARMA